MTSKKGYPKGNGVLVDLFIILNPPPIKALFNDMFDFSSMTIF